MTHRTPATEEAIDAYNEAQMAETQGRRDRITQGFCLGASAVLIVVFAVAVVVAF